ncbi:MAG TPA: helix-turn-helix transcriptional regulator [Ktedonobacteraceae bacterium]
MARLQVKEVAQKKNLTQKALAEKSGVTIQLLNRYWNNNIQRVDLEELNKIAIALGVEPGELIVSENRKDS